MSKSILWCAAVLALPQIAVGATLRPANTMQFFVTPDKPARLQWKVEGGTLAGPVEYVLRDYSGSSTGVSSPATRLPSHATLAGDSVEVTLRLAQGFHEIEFPATKQRFGIVALPPADEVTRRTDEFFCIDGALSWLVHDDAVREGLVEAADRSGIHMIRERLTWGDVHPAPDRRDWQTGNHYDTLRQACLKHGVEVLEMAHDGPVWMGRVGKYPQDLPAAARSWEKIAAKWQPTWGGLEVWNEPDIFFGANLPADQYVPLVKAVSFGLREGRVRTPVVGGVMAHCNRAYLDTAARNGILDAIDVFSFHTYGRAPEMEGLVEKYRAWLADYGHGSMPLWLTECGRPWQTGPERPPVDQDAESALDITMKAVEAKACGIERYFAFVDPYFEEGKNNFGMMDKQATPLRSFAAYAQAARVLADHSYVGDLKHSDKRILRARVFRNAGGAVVVIYTGRVDPDATVQIGLPVWRIEGIDGRELKRTASGEIPVPDGIVYLRSQWEYASQRAEMQTKAAALAKAAREPRPRREALSPLILRYQWDDKLLEPTPEGYRFRGEPPKKMPVAVRVFNLAKEPRDVALSLRFHENDPLVSPPDPPQVKVPAEGFADVRWSVHFTDAMLQAKRFRVIVTARAEGDPRPPTLDLEWMRSK